MSDKEKEITAYHEAGHAIVGHVLPDSDSVHKVTIIPRGGTGGVTWFIPQKTKATIVLLNTKTCWHECLAVELPKKSCTAQNE